MQLAIDLPPAPGEIRRALISVFDKTGLEALGKGLAAANVEVLASGGTAKSLEAAGVPVVKVEDYTQSPEVLDGRVKTLHPKIHAGILADRRQQAHMASMEEQQWPPIDLVVCNLYPFADGLARGASHAEQIELIDIGGPTLVRAAAKNADGGVAVLTDPADYQRVLESIGQDGTLHPKLRRQLAAKAFQNIAEYDMAIASYWSQQEQEGTTELPTAIEGFTRGPTLRYGENPHQQAALYLYAGEPDGVAHGKQLAGKELSYNNYLDLDAAYRASHGLDEHGCAIVKHTNPCGLAQSASQKEAFERALAGDPISAFGSIIGFNQPLEPATVEAMLAAKLFVECIVAPGFTQEAVDMLAKRENLRLVQMGTGFPAPAWHAHRIGGGLLVQQCDPGVVNTDAWRVVTQKKLEDGWLDELRFAMHAVFTLKSNAIAVTKEKALLGAGAGQMSRVDATEQALKKAGDASNGAFLASDAFFPFDDSVRLAAKAGVVAMVQPGGSKRDEEVIAACDELGLAMAFTGQRHFRH